MPVTGVRIPVGSLVSAACVQRCEIRGEVMSLNVRGSVNYVLSPHPRGETLLFLFLERKGLFMWGDVVIGDEETQKRRGGSARGVKIADPVPDRFSISENAREFWISGVFLGLGMTVGKNTALGARLTEELAAESSGVYIVKMLQNEFIPLVNPERLVNAVNGAIDWAHESGRREKAAEIRRVLWRD